MSEGREGPSGPAESWAELREWNGSRQRAFEELTFQLRDDPPPGWRVVKTGDPDGGVEWYYVAPDGEVHGFQAKFVADVDDLIQQTRVSVRTVGANRASRNVTELTVYAPFDMPDAAPRTTKTGRVTTSARQRWDDVVAKWQAELPGFGDMEIRFVGSGMLLDRLNQSGNEGKRWFFFNQMVLGPQWCEQRLNVARAVAGERYTPEQHLSLPAGAVLDGLVLSRAFRERVLQTRERMADAFTALSNGWERWRVEYANNNPAGQPIAGDLAVWLSTLEANLREILLTGEQVEVALPASADEICDLPCDAITALTDRLLQAMTQWRILATTFSEQIPSSDPEGTTSGPSETPSASSGGRSQRASFSPDDRLRPGPALRAMVSHGAFLEAMRAAQSLRFLMLTDAARAAEAKAWLLLGPAGQGKTHLLFDGAFRALKQQRPALVVLGEQLSGNNPLSEIAQRIGLNDLPHDHLLQALDSAGAAADCRFLLVIDAVNDADHATRWKSELPGLLAALARYPHVALVISCRSTMADVVLSDKIQDALPTTHHAGFDGYELEALERYLTAVPHLLPRTPLLLPAFSNPLFVKLYAASLAEQAEAPGGEIVVSGQRYRSQVFASFLDSRARVICHRLGLDHHSRPVHRAVNALAVRMAETRQEVLARDEARDIVDAFAPGQRRWPDTMLGMLISEGVLHNERYRFQEHQPTIGVGFTYQAFSDDLIVLSVLDRYADDVERIRAGATLPLDSALRQWLAAASPTLRESATVLLPERAGAELIDILGLHEGGATDSGPAGERPQAFRMLLTTLPLRSPDSVTPRTEVLIATAVTVYNLGNEQLDAALTVTAEPGHPYNADQLHIALCKLPRPERDAVWGIPIYHMLDGHRPLHRLLRWAEQVPTPAHLVPARPSPARPALLARRAGTHPTPVSEAPAPLPAEIVRLAATTLTWTLTSSNRFLRDRATKALAQMLLGYPEVLTGLLDRFLSENAADIDDPYLFERLVLATYGVLLRAGHAHPTLAGEVARRLISSLFRDPADAAHASHSLLLCNAAQGILDLAVRLGQVTEADVSNARHPHAAAPVGPAPSETELENRFARADDPRQSWSPVLRLLNGSYDFTDHQIRPAMSDVTRLPISQPRPPGEPTRPRPGVHLPSLPAFGDSLPAGVRDIVATPAGVQYLLNNETLTSEILTTEQIILLHACEVPPPADAVLFAQEQDQDEANRWIAATVADLGWTPQRFGTFDQLYGTGKHPKDRHKAERIGKKYQWLALFAYGEAMINCFHVKDTFGAEEPDHVASWQLGFRDLDPSLPPGPHPLPNTLDEHNADTTPLFGLSPAGDFWIPPAPALPGPAGIDAWITAGEEPQGLDEFLIRTDAASVQWVVLDEVVTDTTDGRGFEGDTAQAEQNHRISTWLVRADQADTAFNRLDSQTTRNPDMFSMREPHGIYLGEFPSAVAAHDPAGFDTGHTDVLPPARSSASNSSLLPGMPDVFAFRSKIRDLIDTDTDQTTVLSALAWAWANDDETANAEEPVRDHANEAVSHHVEQSTPHEQSITNGHDDEIPLLAAAQRYGWDGAGPDCSLDRVVNASLPSNTLLGLELVRHPDRPDWYDKSGTLVAIYRAARRETGTLEALLVSRTWLCERLTQLDCNLLADLKLSRLPTTTTLPHWAEYAHAALLTHDDELRYGQRHKTVGTSAWTRSGAPSERPDGAAS